MYYKIFSGVLIALHSFFICSGQACFQSENLNLNDGLSDLRVQDIVQDKFGYMWFATTYGLNRYDGYTIKQFIYDSTKQSIPSNGIYSLFKDSKGDLWIGTTNGIAKFDYTHGVFHRIDSIAGRRAGFIRVITEDPEGNLYVGGSNGIFKFNSSLNAWSSITAAFKRPNELIAVRGLYFKDKNTLFVTTEKRGFYELDLIHFNCKMIIYEDHEACYWDVLMYDMEPLGKDELLISFLSLGVRSYNMRTGAIRRIPGAFYDSKAVRWNTVPKIYKDKQDRIWIASVHFGLCEYIVDKDTIISYLNSAQMPYGLETGSVNCVFQDNQNNLWIGSGSQGVYKVNPSQNRVFFYTQNDFQPTKLQSSNVNIISEWNPQTLIIGQTKGFSLFHLNTKTFTNYPGDANNRGTNFLKGVYSVGFDRKNNLWFGTLGLGIMVWKKGDLFTQNYYIGEFGKINYPHVFISQSITLSDGKFLNLGIGKFSLLDPNQLTNKTNYNSPDTLFKYIDVKYIHNLGNDRVLILHGNNDFSIYDHNSNTIIRKPNFLNKKFPGIRVSKMENDTFGNLWFATNQGLLLMKPDSSFHLYKMEINTEDRFSLTGFQRVGSAMWIANSRRVGRLNLETGSIQYLTEADGFFVKQLNGNTLTRASNGNLYLGCTDGIYEIIPDQFKDEPKLYDPRLISFSITNENPIPLCLEDSCTLNLKHNQNYFSFQLSAFDYCERNDLKYSYKLEGFDKNWIDMGNDRMGYYTNVDPGSYTLKFRVRNITKNWVEGKQKLSISIQPPFWKTKLFAFLLFGLISGLVYWFFQFKLQTMQREERLRSEFEIKIHELENSALRTQMNPHFIFNCLNTINAFVQKNDRANAGLMISKFSKLIRMILNHSREKRISLKEELEALELYIQIESTRFESKFEYQISVAPDIYTDAIEFPSLIIQPFVENAILHGLLPLREKGFLSISISTEDKHLMCRIKDNGIGRDAAKQLRPQQSHQKSHGLEITLKRIELYNLEHKFAGVVKILDLRDSQGNASGTLIEIPIAMSLAF